MYSFSVSVMETYRKENRLSIVHSVEVHVKRFKVNVVPPTEGGLSVISVYSLPEDMFIC